MRPAFPQRIAVIGVTGAGKSTFARQLQDKTGLPLFHTDSVIWKNGWQHPASNDDLLAFIDNATAHPEWLLEGYLGYTAPVPDTRLQRADLVVVLDYHRIRLAWHVLKRTIRYHGRHRPEFPAECKEKLKWRLFRKLGNYLCVKNLRDNLNAWTAHIPPEKILRFTSPAQAEKWLRKFG